ncbi:MAG: hypothetical protein H6822_01860 [Planctomycetaceae bacterium]|nr:hypothetical protein [Planctomycetales bacterium]MCB9920894.1 hypothetical protein [Planctomycetaceae bacterium]
MTAFLYLGIFALSSTIVCGMTATLNPDRFMTNARFWGRWIETRPSVPIADRRVDIDEFVLQHTRVFGVAVLAASMIWTTLLLNAA